MKSRLFGVLIAMALLYSNIANGQGETDKLIFRSLDEDLGISNSNVLSMIRDADGMMWFATAYGLYRYDGTHTKIFFNTNDSTSISNHNVIKLFLGPYQGVWVKNVNNIFDIYDPKTEIFSRGVSLFKKKFHLASDSVGMLIKDRQDRFWFTHPDKGISIFSEKNTETIYLRHSEHSGSLSSNKINGIAEAPNGLIWVIGQSGIIDILDPNSLVVTQSLRLPVNEIPDEAIYELVIDSDGDTWIFNPERDLGVFRVEAFSHKIFHYSENSTSFPLNNNMVKTIIEAKKGEIWLGTDHGGINVIDKNAKTIRYLSSSDSKSEGMLHNVVYSLLKDDEDIIWIGSHKQGVSYYHQGLLRFSHIRKNFSDPNSLPYNDVNAFAEDSLGNLYIGTNGGGMFYYNRKNNTYKQFKHHPDDQNTIVGDVIVDMIIDHEGILWIGTYLTGLSSFDGKKFTNYLFDPKVENGLPGPSIWKLFEDSQHNIWIGSLRSGISILNTSRNSFQNYSAGAPPFYIHNQYITGFEEDLAGNIWISGGSGLNYVNLKSKKSKFYTADQSSGLSSSNITDLFTDKQDVLWVTTLNGLHYFDPQDSLFVAYGESEGLPTSYLVDMLEDNSGNLWISSQSGISYAEITRTDSPFSIVFQNFDQRDGLQASLFNKNSALKTTQNEFIFGGPNGYNIFKSENFAFERKRPPVIFTDFQLFNQEVSIGEKIGERVLLTQSLMNMEKIVLRHDENIFSVGFSALNFLYPEKSKYRYKLLGFNEDWIYLNDDLAKVTFTNLDPGDYTLSVQPGSGLDGWSPDVYTLDIRILAPFWQTPVAYFIYLMTVIASIAYSRNQLIKRQQERFELRQAEREAKRIQDLDTMKTQFFTNLSHEFRTPLSLILTPTEHLMSQTQNPLMLNQYHIIQRNARRLLKLINQLLDVKNLEKGGISYQPLEGDVVQYIRECISDFYELSENKHINLSFESNINSQQAIFDPDKIEKILFNLLSNAFKFTPQAGQISVILDIHKQSDEQGRLTLSVSDSGIGISSDLQTRIFDRFYTTEGDSGQINQGSGIGLSLAQDFAKMMEGVLTVESEKGEGSTFTLQLPLVLIARDEVEDIVPATGNYPQRDLILVADDHSEFRTYIKDCLSETYQVLLAKNGEEAWNLAQQHIPDLIITDLMMPKMDGKELCQHVKGEITTSHIPIILLTAKKSEEAIVEGLGSGCNLYLTKPFNLEILQLSVKNLLKERSKIQEKNRSKIEISGSEIEAVSLDDQLIQKAIAIVEEHIEDTQLSVEFLSKKLAMSRVHLYKKLHSLTGKSPIEFIRLIRMKRAAQLFEKTQKNVSEVAYAVGYNNAKYFTKHFKLEFNMTPSDFAAKFS
jgi:signal transduction histidine kinase/ligand-binding sensor domain-containing protein/DNA-binding response OmpR family regulator